MSDMQHLMELLKSDNPNQRYEACEELRVSRQPLPQEVIDALHSTVNDPDSSVADAAQRALALHTQEVVDKKDNGITNASLNLPWPLIGLLVGLVPTFCLFSNEDFPGILCLPSFTTSLSLMGAYFGKRRMITAIIGAVLGEALGLGLLLYIVVVAQ